jgi:prepilin-type N-terminal cleavage/methylation domain-containing protein
MKNIRNIDRNGFTLIEIVIAVAIVAIFAAALSPMVFRHLEDAKVGKAQNETEVIANAVMTYYKDVGKWPITNVDGPSGNDVRRVLSSTVVATGAGPDAQSGSRRWGNFGTTKQLGDYLYFNNADNNSSSTGESADQPADWPTSGPGAWKGPYVESYDFSDPWGNAYVINSQYFQGRYTGSVRHKVFVLSAGPNGVWETGFANNSPEEISGDDIGSLISIIN